MEEIKKSRKKSVTSTNKKSTEIKSDPRIDILVELVKIDKEFRRSDLSSEERSSLKKKKDELIDKL